MERIKIIVYEMLVDFNIPIPEDNGFKKHVALNDGDKVYFIDNALYASTNRIVSDFPQHVYDSEGYVKCLITLEFIELNNKIFKKIKP